MFKGIFVLLAIICLCSGNSEKVYNGYKVYDISVNTEDDLEALKNLDMSEGEKRELDFLSFHNNLQDDIRVMVKPEEQKFVEKFLGSRNINFKISTENVQDAIDKESQQQKELSKFKTQGITFDRYYRYEEIDKYLKNLPESNKNIQVKSAGKSHEGRDIKVVTITNGDGQKKNSVFIDAGIHAREWIAPATALYLIDQLTDSNSNMSKLLEKVDIVIQPLVNPDGYEFTFTYYRLWRKTRSRHGICSGVDANRNYDFHWHEVGSSNNQCAETYHGPKAFSEKESTISGQLMNELKENCKFFLTFHSYGNYLLYPYGYKYEQPENWQDNDDVAKAGANAILAATGTNYTVGGTSNTLYLASGSSIDYAHGVANIPISIVMELSGGGYFGFDLPPSEIDKNVKEAAIGVYAMIETVASKFSN